MTSSHSLSAHSLSLSYGPRCVITGMDVDIVPGAITSIIGPNGCGKSTLLRALSRLLQPTEGEVILDTRAITGMPARRLARLLGLLPQSPTAPEGITVADLVGRGRTPHQGLLGRWSEKDYAAVAEALTATGLTDLAERSVDELSGGQRQRVWIAMALAQETDILLLDEPTTYLDVANQLDILDLMRDLNATRGTTIVMVLHDLNLAARYSDRLIAVRDGAVRAAGTPEEVVTAPNVREIFGLDSRVMPDPVSGRPMVMPIGRHHILDRVPAPHQPQR
jgi:iron complex transport system ATP-binding protein